MTAAMVSAQITQITAAPISEWKNRFIGRDPTHPQPLVENTCSGHAFFLKINRIKIRWISAVGNGRKGYAAQAENLLRCWPSEFNNFVVFQHKLKVPAQKSSVKDVGDGVGFFLARLSKSFFQFLR